MGLFKKKEKYLYAFANGQSVAIENVPDEVFSTKMMGEGFAIIPDDGFIYAPCDGIVSMIMDHSYHAIGIINEHGMEILLHIGLDSVNLMGEGFEVFVNKQQSVKKGDKLLQFDKKIMSDREINDISMLVIVESNHKKVKYKHINEHVDAGKTVLIEFE